MARTISIAKEKIQKAEANIPLAKARFEGQPLKDLVTKSTDKLSVSSSPLHYYPTELLIANTFTIQNFIKSWFVEEYYNDAMEGVEELAVLLPALEVYSSDSGIATTLKVARDKILAVETLVPQAKMKFEAEPLREKVSQVSSKLDVRVFLTYLYLWIEIMRYPVV